MHALVAHNKVEDADVVGADDEGYIFRRELLVMGHIVHSRSWINPKINVAGIHFNGRGKGRGQTHRYSQVPAELFTREDVGVQPV